MYASACVAKFAVALGLATIPDQSALLEPEAPPNAIIILRFGFWLFNLTRPGRYPVADWGSLMLPFESNCKKSWMMCVHKKGSKAEADRPPPFV